MPRMGDVSDDGTDDIVVDSKPKEKASSRAPASPLSHRPRRSTSRTVQDKVVNTIEDEEDEEDGGSEVAFARKIQVRVAVPKPLNREEYAAVEEDDTVRKVVDQTSDGRFKVIYADGREDTVTKQQLSKLPSGTSAWTMYINGEDDKEYISPKPARRRNQDVDSSDELRIRSTRQVSMGKRTRGTTPKKYTFAQKTDDEDELASDPKRQRVSRFKRTSRGDSNGNARAAESEDEKSEDDTAPAPARATRSRFKAPEIVNKPLPDDYDDESIIMGENKGRRAAPAKGGRVTRGSNRKSNVSNVDDSDSVSVVEVATRKSDRANKATRTMMDHLEDEEMFADESVDSKSGAAPKVISVREIFKPLPARNEFRLYHNDTCDSCGFQGTESSKGPSPLIHCQGCTASIHKICLGYRSQREHRVTKIGDGDFVLQCRRCIGLARKKDPMAPDLGVCQIDACKKHGIACAPFSTKKTSAQEEKLREENGGEDPITEVSPERINNPLALLFRCIGCQRGFHFNHLPPLSDHSHTSDNEAQNQEYRFGEYSRQWKCKDCIDAPAKPSGIVAWRPTDIESYTPGQAVDQLTEDSKEYLVRWTEMSYFRCTWMPGAWCWGTMAAAMRKAFIKRCFDQNSGLPIMSEKDAIPEEFLRIEIVLDVKYSSRVTTRTEEVDKARINEVDKVFVKFIGLGYEECVWEAPPPKEDTERYADFQAAYNEYIAGKYFKQRKNASKNMTAYRAKDFNKEVVLKEQPAALVGGKLMEYQMDGMNWLLYNFHQEKNVILADEMGLGKTIQVIAALTALITEGPKCFPFLIVVPNSTCPNWRREIKQWAPSLRVVAYYGTRESREVAKKYEMFPDGRNELAAHIVVTSYEAPVDDRQFFNKIKWTGMIVDEGQRLKNDKNLLYQALLDMKIPFRVLLTGTPVQNNKLELFTLLQFLDKNVNAAELDAKFENLTNDNIEELWALIKPLILRRTKAQVLKFLPPMAQVIIPVTMSVVQKKLYKSIIAKSPELLRAIYGKDHSSLKPQERGGLNNILMQLRKCLCHPFVYSEAIEERSKERTVLHRNLVDASSKLQLLEIMLPKLQERGHRVLIFSQFLKQLDIIEDFLDGLGMQFQRLDGSIGTLEKQKRIDAYNAPDSSLFAFLLSTRAGGVGINLATADTVIIMDPDFNPHQDLQALSRAHRIGQKKKVLVFQLMTKDSAEEKIVQIGRRKMALDQAIIESMGDDDDAGIDVQTILQHGAMALFEDDDRNDIKYDSASVDKLLDRSQVEQTNTSEEKTAESQFSFARIWANDTGTLNDDVGDPDERAGTPNEDVWKKILQEREEEARREEEAKQQQFGRGKRARQIATYGVDALDGDVGNRRRSGKHAEDSDFDLAEHSSSDREPESGAEDEAGDDIFTPKTTAQAGPRKVDDFVRVKIAKNHPSTFYDSGTNHQVPPTAQLRQCLACNEVHPIGYCRLKLTGFENCGLCGIAHYGGARQCPNLQSETQVRLMLDALKTSTDTRENIDMARRYLRGVVGDLVRRKKAAREHMARKQMVREQQRAQMQEFKDKQRERETSEQRQEPVIQRQISESQVQMDGQASEPQVQKSIEKPQPEVIAIDDDEPNEEAQA